MQWIPGVKEWFSQSRKARKGKNRKMKMWIGKYPGNTRIEILNLRLVPKDKLINPLRSLRLCQSFFTRLAKRSRIH